MPVIFQGSCRHCGHQTNRIADSGSAVVAYSGAIVNLGHPLETSQLATQGFTWSEARRERRLIVCLNMICQDCGEVYEKRQISDNTGFEGCLPALICAGLAALFTITMRESLLLSLVAFLGVFFPLNAILERVLRSNWATQRAEVRFTIEDRTCDCQHPDPARLKTLSQAAFGARVFPCTSCGEPAMTYRRVGIS